MPPKERACVILKDVLDRSLAEISEILDTSTMAVKAALHRGRQKLRTAEAVSNSTRPSVGKPELLRLYVDLFNKRDWEGVKTLIKADARCEVVGLWAGVGRDAIEGTYLRKYASLDVRWRMSLVRVDGEEVVICLGDDAGHWVPRSIVRIEWAGDLVKSIRDYIYIPYLFDDARIVTWG